MPPTAIEPEHFDWLDYRKYTFSLGLTADADVFLSGHSASCYDPSEGRVVVRGGVAEQCRTAYEKIGSLLEACGLGPASVVHVVEYVTAEAVDRYPEIEGVRAEALREAQPAVSTVIVSRLLRRNAFVEIEVTARADAGLEASATLGGEPGDRVPSAGGAAAAPAYSLSAAAGDVVYLSSMLPVDRRGELVDGGVDAQAEQIYDNVDRVLAAAGMGPAHLVKTLDYVSVQGVADYKLTGRVRRDRLGPVYPAAAGIVTDRVAHPGALLQVDCIASRSLPHPVNPGWDRYEKLTYSPAVRAGDALFLSGLAALDPTTQRAVHEGDIAAQAEFIYGNVLEVVRAAGGHPRSLVRTVEYVTGAGLARYRDTAPVRAGLLSAPYPASTGVVCAGLLRPEFELEVDAMAVLS
ncbi:MAG: RidA family protein [Acidimicrobiaceae bacterium]|nr:RidA family protein [Acidimicrobiaceae bacterium]